MGIVGGRTYFDDMTLNPELLPRPATPWSLLCMGSGLSSVFRRSRLFDLESLGPWPRDTDNDVDIVTGCFCLVRRELWATLGGFDEGFFMYGEDTDLCIRAWQAGSACAICAEGAADPLRRPIRARPRRQDGPPVPLQAQLIESTGAPPRRRSAWRC